MMRWPNLLEASHAGSPVRTKRYPLVRTGVVSFAAIIITIGASAERSNASTAEPATVDTAIVLAVDTSASVGPAQADFQREGHAAALRSSEVRAAIENGMTGCIVVTYVEWAGIGELNTVLPWTKLCNASDLDAAADVILRGGDNGFQRKGRGRTSLSFAIDISAFLLERSLEHARRKVIDLSSNGTNNDGSPVAPRRQAALEKGYIINAIAIAPSEPGIADDLPDYYRREVIGGPGSFVIAPHRIEDYATALRRKLVLEIAGLMPHAFGCEAERHSIAVMPLPATADTVCVQ